ncbi:MAG TPA: glycosyltransferase family 2 protein, partial [Candidatus Binatia bacterium]|nr:glycosyltransferase family 2 protein [Candidatus Binatia bacterium]
MDTIEFLSILTLLSFGFLFYTYVGYPGLLWLLSKLARRPEQPHAAPTAWPAVSILISAYNEEHAIGARIENLLKLDYPKDRVEILIGSDGSNDRTAEIVAAYPGVRLLKFAQRRGKASVLNDLVAAARNEIVVFTDANTFFRPDAVRELVQALWRHPFGSVAVGRLELRSAADKGNLDGAYWRYESWIKTLESRFGSLLGANGAIYAFRRDRYRPVPPAAIVDDFLIPMLMRRDYGDRIFFVPAARAWEDSPEEVKHEFRRRVRIGAGDFQALKWTWQLLLPSYGMIALIYFSHKVLRWLGPWFLLAGLIGSLMLLNDPLFEILLAGQLLFYTLALAGAALRPLPAVGRLAVAARYFVILNVGLLLGLVRLSLGAARPTWSTAPRK